VVTFCLAVGVGNALLLAQAAETAFERLPPATRARVLAALAGLIILGMALVLLTWLGARATRRYMRIGQSSRPSATVLDQDDWARKPIHPDEGA
jgi:hypothetical protein